MANALTVYDRATDPTAMMLALGSAIAKSQIFGCENESQGIVIAMTCMVRQVDPLSLAERNHLFHGKLSMKADAMLAGLRQLGAIHKIISRTHELAEIEITRDGNTVRFALSWEDALKEPFVYNGKEQAIVDALAAGKPPKLKPKYATPRSRMQMLWARVVSDGVRAVAPEVCVGSYSPEEVADMDEVVEAEQSRSTATVVETPRQAPPTAGRITQAVESRSVATGDQVRQLTAMFQTLGIPADKQLAAFKKRGATDMGDLSEEAAAELLASLEAKLAATMEGQSNANEAVISAPSNGPASESQIEAIRTLVKQIAQQDGGAEIANQLKAGLAAKGMKLADLSRSEASELEKALAAKNLETFFAGTLVGHSPDTASKNE